MVNITVFDHVGYHGPTILFASTTYLIWERKPYLIMYILGMILNMVLNGSLKMWIRQPRPKHQIDFMDNETLTGVNRYGMPSGHAQMSFFSIVYLLCMKRPTQLYMLVFIVIGCLTLYQRVKFGRHTIEQVVIGTIIGSIFSYMVYRFTKRHLEN